MIRIPSPSFLGVPLARRPEETRLEQAALRLRRARAALRTAEADVERATRVHEQATILDRLQKAAKAL